MLLPALLSHILSQEFLTVEPDISMNTFRGVELSAKICFPK